MPEAPVLSWREQEETVTLRLQQVRPDVAEMLASSFWNPVDDGWEREFPAEGLGIEAVKQNLPRLVGPMAAQAGASFQPWQQALDWIASRAEATGLRWWLTGSGASAIRVPGIEPHDLDVMLDESQLELAATVFADSLVEPIRATGGWVTRAFGVAFIGMRVDLAAGPEPFVDQPDRADFGPWAEQHLETVIWNGHLIRVPPLDIQADVNRRRGRLDRAARIEEMLGKVVPPGDPLCGHRAAT